jgi:hypothetical protein
VPACHAAFQPHFNVAGFKLSGTLVRLLSETKV